MSKSKKIIDQSFIKYEINEMLQNILNQIYRKCEDSGSNISDLLDINDFSPIDRFEMVFFIRNLIE